MTEVEFHTGVVDPVGFASRLLRKACRQGARVQVTAPPEQLAALDQALWLEPERDFVPHVRMPGTRAALARRTPVWLATAVCSGDEAPAVLVNLGAPPPPESAALQRLIEIVSAEPEEAARGRERWRDYRAAGWAIKHHAAADRG